MRRSSLFGHTIELIDLVRTPRQPADGVAQEYFRNRHYLGSKDRRFIAETMYGVLRHWRLLEACAGEVLGARTKPIPAVAYLGTITARLQGLSPEDLLPDLEGFWKMAGEEKDCLSFLTSVTHVRPAGLDSSEPFVRLALQYSLPDFVVRDWLETLGLEETEQLCASSNMQAPTALRVNTLLCTVDECRIALAAEGVSVRNAGLAPTALVLEKRVNTQAVKAFQKGWFEIQDEGSQIIALLADPAAGSVMVDACAGGGGKTLHLGALMKNKGALVAIDLDERRLGNIRERVRRSGLSIVETGMANAADAWKGKADVVLVDAPCSGTGTFRRNPGAKRNVSPAMVERLTGIQEKLLDRYAQLVKPGGRLVYATCSLLRAENAEVVARFQENHPGFVVQPVAPLLEKRGIHIPCEQPTLHLYPHRNGTDGFFAAVMQSLR